MKVKRSCDYCRKEYLADSRNLNRGWGLCCSKSCAAHKREKSRPDYDPAGVAKNNIIRKKGRVLDENIYGIFRGKYTSEGYKVYVNESGTYYTAVNDFDEPVYSGDIF